MQFVHACVVVRTLCTIKSSGDCPTNISGLHYITRIVWFVLRSVLVQSNNWYVRHDSQRCRSIWRDGMQFGKTKTDFHYVFIRHRVFVWDWIIDKWHRCHNQQLHQWNGPMDERPSITSMAHMKIHSPTIASAKTLHVSNRTQPNGRLSYHFNFRGHH